MYCGAASRDPLDINVRIPSPEVKLEPRSAFVVAVLSYTRACLRSWTEMLR